MSRVPRFGRGSTLMVLSAALVLSSCSAGKMRGVLATVFDGVPEPGGRAAEPPPPTPRTAPATTSAAPDPAGLNAAAPAPAMAAAPLESLRTWERVRAALPVRADGGVDWVTALDRGLITPRLLQRPRESPDRSPTLGTLISLMGDDPRRPALDLDVQIRPEAVETPEVAEFYAVRFPHSKHTTWLGCSSCHPGVRVERTGMQGILQGRSCGRCHGRVSFAPEVSCGRCHPNLVPPAPDSLAVEVAAAGAAPAGAGPEIVERGATVYRRMCAVCHGESGDGQGPLGPLVDPRPRDFTAGKYKFRTTLPASIPTDLDIFTTITRGVPGTSMPAFAALPRADRWALTHFLKTLSAKFASSTPQPIPMAPPPDATPELLEMGRKLYVEAGCNLCHGDSGRGDGPSAPTLKDDWGHRLRPFNFASGRPLKGGSGPDAIYRALMTGLQGTPMPGFGDALGPEQGWALVSYVQTFFGQAPQPFAVKGDIEFRRAAGATGSLDTLSFRPALFPHWFHRIRFKCASCHPDVFRMRAGGNAVSMTALRSGQFCGQCHNGSVAWEIGFNTCGQCHPGASPPGAAPPDHGARLEPAPGRSATPARPADSGGEGTRHAQLMPWAARVPLRPVGRVTGPPPAVRLAGASPVFSAAGQVVPAVAGRRGVRAVRPARGPAPARVVSTDRTGPAVGRAPGGQGRGAVGTPRRSLGLDRWVHSGGEVAVAGAWLLGGLLRAGKWTGENAATFERDSRDTEGELETFQFQRELLGGELSLRNSDLALGSHRLAANVGVDLSYRRETIRAGERSSPGIGRVAGYDVNVTARPDDGLTFGVFSARNRTELPRLFGTIRDQLLTRRGAQLHLSGPLLRSTLQWTRLRSESVARLNEGTRRDGEDRTVLEYTGTRRTGRHAVTIQHRRERREDLIDPDLSFPQEFTRLRYGIQFGQHAGNRSLMSSFGLNRRGGRMTRENLRVESRLDFSLRPRLDSRTTVRFERVELPGFERRRRALDIQATHRLYESLVTTAGLRSSREDLLTGDRRLSGTDLLLEYRKKLAGGGRLVASVGRRWDRDNNHFEEREDFVQGEAHEARIAAPFRIEQARVDPGSVVITDAEEALVYREGIDYTLKVIGEFIEVGILPQGLIADGQTLLVDYRFRVAPFTRTGTRRSHLDVSVDYGWITPHLLVHDASRELRQGSDDGSLFDRTGRAAGVRFRLGRENLRLHLSNDWQADDARNLSFESWQFGQTLTCILGPDLTLTANVDENTTTFRIPERRESRQSATFDVWWQATPGLSLRAAAAARERHDTLGFGEQVYRASLDAGWKRESLSLTASATGDWGSRDGRRFRGLRIASRLSRSF